MSIKEVTAEGLASLIFHYQAALAPDFGCASAASANWQQVPANERQRMIAAARLTLLDLSNGDAHQTQERREARRTDHRPEEGREWGC